MTGPPLSYIDEAVLLLAEGAAQEAVLQLLWTYDRPVDLAGLERSREAINRSLVSRRIERSPIPFCRSRWVRSPGPGPEVQVSNLPVSPDSIFEWADEQVALPLDPLRGPTWQLSVAALVGGGSIVSVVASHSVTDGWGLTDALCGAFTDGEVPGKGQLESYPLPHALTRRAAAREDLRQLAHDAPAIARALLHGGRLAGSGLRRARRRSVERRASTPTSSSSRAIASFTTVAAYLDEAHLTERAAQVSGTTSSLLAACAIRLAESLGRAPDGAVNLIVPLLDDGGAADRANAVTLARFPVDVRDVQDQRKLRETMRLGIADARASGEPLLDLLPLVPFVPRRAAGQIRDSAIAPAALRAVTFSHLGRVPGSIVYPDRTPAQRVLSRGVDRNLTVGDLEDRGGVLSVISAFVDTTVVVTVVSYQLDASNSRGDLKDMMDQAFMEFGLSASYL